MVKKMIVTAGMVMALAACKKDAEYCWNCKHTYSGGKADLQGDTAMCNYTQKEIERRQNKRFASSKKDWDYWTLTDCKKQ